MKKLTNQQNFRIASDITECMKNLNNHHGEVINYNIMFGMTNTLKILNIPYEIDYDENHNYIALNLEGIRYKV